MTFKCKTCRIEVMPSEFTWRQKKSKLCSRHWKEHCKKATKRVIKTLLRSRRAACTDIALCSRSTCSLQVRRTHAVCSIILSTNCWQFMMLPVITVDSASILCQPLNHIGSRSMQWQAVSKGSTQYDGTGFAMRLSWRLHTMSPHHFSESLLMSSSLCHLFLQIVMTSRVCQRNAC